MKNINISGALKSIGYEVPSEYYYGYYDGEYVWQKNVKTEIRTKANGREDRIEKLFKLKINI